MITSKKQAVALRDLVMASGSDRLTPISKLIGKVRPVLDPRDYTRHTLVGFNGAHSRWPCPAQRRRVDGFCSDQTADVAVLGLPTTPLLLHPTISQAYAVEGALYFPQ